MNKYEVLMKINNHRDYSVVDTIPLSQKSCEKAEFLFNNYDKMSFEELKHILFQCMTEKEVRHQLLKYEFYNLTIKP